MPTGYTSILEKGNVSFEQFVMQCARAFGACVTMRDDDFDKSIPNEFKPSTYHLKEIKNINEEIKKVKAMSVQEAAKASQKEYYDEVKSYKRYISKADRLRKIYEDMLKKVNDWKAPGDICKLKEFMIEQLTGSIDNDCNTIYYMEEIRKLKLMTGSEWKENKIRGWERDLKYHIKENDEEIDRVAGRNKWIRELRQSLK